MNELNMLLLPPIGSLRISLPAFMASSSISTALAEFVRLYPQIKLSVSYSDLPVGLLDDGFDLNIRTAWLNDSSMMPRNWDWIKLEPRAEQIELTSDNGQSVKVSGQYQLQVDNIDALFFSHVKT